MCLMSKGNTFKICPNGPCTFPPNHVINIKVKNMRNFAGFPRGIILDTTNVKRSKDGYLPSFKVTYDQSNTFNCNKTQYITLDKKDDNVSRDDGGYKYEVQNSGDDCGISLYAVLDITVPNGIYVDEGYFVVDQGLIVDMTQMGRSSNNCTCNATSKQLSPSVHIQYDAFTAETPAAE